MGITEENREILENIFGRTQTGIAETTPPLAAITPGNRTILDNIFESLPEAKKGLFTRIGEDFENRLLKIEESTFRFESRGKSLGSFADFTFDIGGQAFGLLFDIAGEGLNEALTNLTSLGKFIASFTPEDFREDFKKEAAETSIKFFTETPAGKATVDALTKGADAWNNFKEKNPDNARRFENLGNILVAFPLKTFRGLIPGRETLKFVTTGGITDVTKVVTKKGLSKVERKAELIAGRGKQKLFGEIVLKTSAQIKNIAKSVVGIVSPKFSFTKNIDRIRNEIKRVAIETEDLLKFNFAIFNKNQLKAGLGKARDKAAFLFASPSEGKIYDNIINKFLEFMDDKPNRYISILQARKEFDSFVQEQVKNLFTGDTPGNLRKQAVKDVRNAANDFIEEALNKGDLKMGIDFRAKLRKQHLMFQAVDNIADNAEAFIGLPTWKKLITAARAGLQLTGIGVVFGQGVLGILSNPIALGILGTAGVVTIASKSFTRKKVLNTLSIVLRASPKILTDDEEEQLNAIINELQIAEEGSKRKELGAFTF